MGEVVIAVAKEVIINILVKEVVKRVLKKQLRANIIIRESHYINEYNVVYFGGYYERVEKELLKEAIVRFLDWAKEMVLKL